MPHFVTCGPNEAIIVSGCCRSNPTIRAGGRVFVWPMFHRLQRLSLNTMTLNVESPKVYSENGVPVTLKGVAQIKIQGQDLAALRTASEMFLDKSEDEIIDIARATLDGHQRSLIASMKIEEIYKNRAEFSTKVQQSAQVDFIDMGLTLVSYTVQDITDDEGYLDALGQGKTVDVRSEARKEVARAKAFSDSKKLEVEITKREKDIQNEQRIELMRLEFEIAKAESLKEHFQNQAKSEKAGDLQSAEMTKRIVEEELLVQQLEKEKEKELGLKRLELKRLELANQVEKRADFECAREKMLAEAYAAKAKAEATAEAGRIERLAQARAEMIKQEREAEAEVLRDRAEAFKEFGNAAKLEMVLAMLPRLTAEIAGPIADCKKITSVSQDGSVGFSRVTGEIFEVVEQLCQSVGNITGQSLMGDAGNDKPGPTNPRSPTESIAPSRATSSLFSSGRRQ